MASPNRWQTFPVLLSQRGVTSMFTHNNRQACSRNDNARQRETRPQRNRFVMRMPVQDTLSNDDAPPRPRQIEIIAIQRPRRHCSVSPPRCVAEKPRPEVGYYDYSDVSPLASPVTVKPGIHCAKFATKNQVRTTPLHLLHIVAK